MSKRKAGVNNIIYELDNDDVELSSEDEAKNAKIKCLEVKETAVSSISNTVSDVTSIEIIDLDSTLDCSADSNCLVVSPTNVQNGGKTSDSQLEDFTTDLTNDTASSVDAEIEIACPKETYNESSKPIDFSEDIVIDSPASNSDLGVVGCENRTPIVTVRFKDMKLAKTYKEKVKAFMLSLIKLHDEESLTGSETETDLELDVWPEDFTEDVVVQEQKEDNLFFVDTAPCDDAPDEIPAYRQNATLISNIEKEPTPPRIVRRGPVCFNCDGAHQLRECPMPRNNSRIAEKRKNMVPRVGRYHIEDDQKYGHLIPGRLSGQLRHALGLKRHELPLHTYRMRCLGYPPGWLEEARISHSGITMFDSTGSAIQDPEEEEGEVNEPGSKDKFDIKKILDFPGFNVPPSSRYKEEAHAIGMPPMSEQDSKMAMLQMLAPNAMKAYKRKKLTIFPSATHDKALEGQAEMELDSGDEVPLFPSIPPLPDEAPPPVAPPPPPPPEDPPSSDQTEEKTEGNGEKSSDDLEIIEVMKVTDIPVPEDELITIDEDDEDDKSLLSTSRDSPTLDDLEERKRKLLDALGGDTISQSSADVSMTDIDLETNKDSATEIATGNIKDTEIVDDITSTAQTKDMTKDSKDLTKDFTTDSKNANNSENFTKVEEVPSVLEEAGSKETHAKTESNQLKTQISSEAKKSQVTTDSDSDVAKTPDNKTGKVKTTQYGTPVMNVASPFTKLPTDSNFAKDICDVINFENLPNSTGKYKQICSLLKKVKSEVDRIQDS